MCLPVRRKPLRVATPTLVDLSAGKTTVLAQNLKIIASR